MEEMYNVSPEILHENEFYSVHPVQVSHPELFVLDNLGCAYDHGYCIVSKHTGQIELVRTSLPDALYNCEHLGKILSTKPYLWLRKEDGDEDPGSSINLEDLN